MDGQNLKEKEEQKKIDSIFEENVGLARKRVDLMEGTKFNNGFSIDYAIGMGLLKTYAPERETVNIKKFTIDATLGSVLLICIGNDDLVLFSIELPDDTMDLMGTTDYEDSIDETAKMKTEYKKVRKLFILMALVTILGVTAAVAVFIYLTKGGVLVGV